jgi:nucleoside-diphosphate-sugar epimerase
VSRRVLVTGCAGFIGSTLTDALLAREVDVRGVDAFTDYYERERKVQNIEAARASPRFELVEADLTVADLRQLLDGVDVVYHLAGQPGVRASWADGFAGYLSNNVTATQRLLEAARSSRTARIVFASSSSIYGNAPSYPVTESTLPRPHSPYGVTKLAAEHLCSLYADNWGLPVVSLRYFSVYGPRQRPDMAFDRFIRAGLTGAPINVFGSGSQVRDFTYVGDVVAATLAAGVSTVPSGTVCNVAGGSSISLLDVLPVIERAVGQQLRVEHQRAEAGDVERTGGSGARARDLLGWAPAVSIDEGLTAQCEWVAAHLSLERRTRGT